MNKIYFTKCLKIFLITTLAVFALGFVFMLLWNWLMPEIFGLTEITWHQAIGLLVLCKILFGFGLSKPKCNKCDKEVAEDTCSTPPSKWKEKMKNRFDSMSDEEKEQLKKRCGSWLDPNNCNKD